MDSPYGNPHHHHHHQRRDDGEDDRQSFGAPPPPRNDFADAPTPPGLYQPQPHFDPYAPHPAAPAPYRSEPQFDPYVPSPPAPAPYGEEPYFEAPAPPPPFGHVSHVGHHTSHQEPYQPDHHRYGAYPPHNSALEIHGDHTGVAHVSHHSSHQTDTPSASHHLPDENRLPDNLAGFAGRKTVKVYSKAEPNYYLTIRDGKVILAPADPSDQAQHWYKDEKYSTRVKDADGHPCFALVNKASGEAMKHSVGATHPVHLIRYDPDRLDESVLWTESKDFGDGYRTIRMVNNVKLNVDAFHGDSKSGGVRDGTTIVLWDWNKGDNQLWKIFPFCNLLPMTGVWWDLNTCPVPPGFDPRNVRRIIETYFRKYYGEPGRRVTIYAVGNLEYVSPQVLEAISDSGIPLIHAIFGGKNLWWFISQWRYHTPPPATIMILSSNRTWFIPTNEGYTILRAFPEKDRLSLAPYYKPGGPYHNPGEAEGIDWETFLKENNSEQDNLDESFEDEHVYGPAWSCYVCTIYRFESCSSFVNHLPSAEHKQNLFESVPYDENGVPVRFCKLCDYPGYDDHNMDIHYNSDEHKQKEKEEKKNKRIGEPSLNEANKKKK